jgi:hypothetical protein
MTENVKRYEIIPTVFISISIIFIYIREILKIGFNDLVSEIVLGFGVLLGIILVIWIDHKLNGEEKSSEK